MVIFGTFPDVMNNQSIVPKAPSLLPTCYNEIRPSSKGTIIEVDMPLCPAIRNNRHIGHLWAREG